MRQMRARRKNADVDLAALDREFSRRVKERDGYVCRMERWNGEKYVEHGIKGEPFNPLDAAHIYGRPHVPPLVRFDPEIGLAACRDCHIAYDKHSDLVRVPLAREFLAYKAIAAVSKVPTPRRMPPNRPSNAA